MAPGGGHLQMVTARSAAQAMMKKETLALAFQKFRLYAGNRSIGVLAWDVGWFVGHNTFNKKSGGAVF